MAIYHLTVKTGSAAKGQSGLAKSNYISREGKYQNRKNDDLVLLKEDVNMPSWAKTGADFWRAADRHERANARIFKELEFALPRELNPQQQVQIIAAFINGAFEHKHPMTIAIHAGKGRNPHCHLMFSERINDGIERTAKTFFKRANRKEPHRGGALKADCSKKWWLFQAREHWANCVNQALEQIHSPERVSHLSLEDQGVDRVPQVHRGVKTHHAMKNGRVTSRTVKVLDRAALIGMDKEILSLERMRNDLQEQQLFERSAPVFPDFSPVGYGARTLNSIIKAVNELHELGVCSEQALNMATLNMRNFSWEDIPPRQAATFKEVFDIAQNYLRQCDHEGAQALLRTIERESPDQGFSPSMGIF